MRVFVAVLALCVLLTSAPSLAQAPAAPAPAPQQPAAAAPAQAPPAFQAGLKYGYVQIQAIAANSNEGKAFNAKVQGLRDQKIKELQDRQKSVQAAQEKLEKGATVMNDQARAQLQAEIERQQRDLQRATEDAEEDVTKLTQQLQVEFERRLGPVIDKVARDKQVHFIFNADAGALVWADPGMNLTAEVIKELDASSTAKPAASTAKP